MLLECDFYSDRSGLNSGKCKVGLEHYSYLFCICYITLLNVLINKFTTGYAGEKVPRTLVVLNSEKKKWHTQSLDENLRVVLTSLM